MTSPNPVDPFPAKPGPRSGRTGRPHPGTNLVMLKLDDLGVIQDCSQACLQVFGYRADELVGSHVSRLLPQLPESDLVRDGRVNPNLAYLCHCGVTFQAHHRDGRHISSELFINRLDAHNVVVLVRPASPAPQIGTSHAFH